MPKKIILYGSSRTVPAFRKTDDILSWIRRGKLRMFVFLNIAEKTMPSDIVELLKQKEGRKSASHYAQVSRAIQELEVLDLIACINPKEKTGRFYKLTKQGMDVRKELKR
ncbi:hypothetical protein COV16_04245 [Candidatus Woesearchaeota archaeon CG10_big_fil_rev_8_21_14_0_10_34_8]|nr:MAG: hypothetical protein COV16_04245 [Candidatus Woesearchaeota archaeon CG10_big_fil_rev_8_21_14_0_10_34_8]